MMKAADTIIFSKHILQYLYLMIKTLNNEK